ncbi:MAG: hypothetical protein C4547_14690 [Phycisphaerales bacterium]|nr:MAG: hypothetical protein C4547_14690 [Phycisphaerales bacterium]
MEAERVECRVQSNRVQKDRPDGSLAAEPYWVAGCCPQRVILLVIAVTSVVQLASMFDQGLWVHPDSVGYVTLAEWLVRHGDFSHELFGGRTPGYPLLLATIFAIAGPASAAVILALQHALVVLVGVLAALTGWELTRRPAVAAVAGLAAGSAWGLTAYASTVLTEAPYAALVACVAWLSVRFAVHGGRLRLATLSTCVAAAALVRPVGLPLLGVCAAASMLACVRAWSAHARGGSGGVRVRLAVLVGQAACGMGPALVPLGAWSLHVQRVHGYDGAGSFGGQSLYLRVIERDNWVDTPNPALDEIRCDVELASRHYPELELDYRKHEHAHLAGRLINGWSYQESGQRMGRAAACAVAARPWAFAWGSVVNAGRILLQPDRIYLAGRSDDACPVDPLVPRPDDLFDDFGERMPSDSRVRGWLSPPRRGPAWPLWSAMAWRFRAWCVAADPLPLLPGDNPYENWVMWCCLSGVAALATRRRSACAALMLIVVLQTVPPGIAPGATPRFAVPVRAWVDLWGVWSVVLCGGWVWSTARRRRTAGRDSWGRRARADDGRRVPPGAVAFDARAD